MTHVRAITGVKRAESSRVVEASRAARTAPPTTVLFPRVEKHCPFLLLLLLLSQLPQGGRRAGTHPSRERSLPPEREERSTTTKSAVEFTETSRPSTGHRAEIGQIYSIHRSRSSHLTSLDGKKKRKYR